MRKTTAGLMIAAAIAAAGAPIASNDAPAVREAAPTAQSTQTQKNERPAPPPSSARLADLGLAELGRAVCRSASPGRAARGRGGAWRALVVGRASPRGCADMGLRLPFVSRALYESI
jgi:hypothetical protein